mmetsp:Transcript_3794/g.9953  ORF Transcript_3794/g.9953 Transcript_3794/m.9953 type:complete len:520 (+) Transcript_3794:101-1660(+)
MRAERTDSATRPRPGLGGENRSPTMDSTTRIAIRTGVETPAGHVDDGIPFHFAERSGLSRGFPKQTSGAKTAVCVSRRLTDHDHRNYPSSSSDEYQLLLGADLLAVVGFFVRLEDPSETFQQPRMVLVDLLLRDGAIVVAAALPSSFFGREDRIAEAHRQGNVALGGAHEPSPASEKRRNAHAEPGRQKLQDAERIDRHVVELLVPEPVDGNDGRAGLEGDLADPLAVRDRRRLLVVAARAEDPLDPIQDDPDVATVPGQRLQDGFRLGGEVAEPPQGASDEGELVRDGSARPGAQPGIPHLGKEGVPDDPARDHAVGDHAEDDGSVAIAEGRSVEGVRPDVARAAVHGDVPGVKGILELGGVRRVQVFPKGRDMQDPRDGVEDSLISDDEDREVLGPSDPQEQPRRRGHRKQYRRSVRDVVKGKRDVPLEFDQGVQRSDPSQAPGPESLAIVGGFHPRHGLQAAAGFVTDPIGHVDFLSIQVIGQLGGVQPVKSWLVRCILPIIALRALRHFAVLFLR